MPSFHTILCLFLWPPSIQQPSHPLRFSTCLQRLSLICIAHLMLQHDIVIFLVSFCLVKGRGRNFLLSVMGKKWSGHYKTNYQRSNLIGWFRPHKSGKQGRKTFVLAEITSNAFTLLKVIHLANYKRQNCIKLLKMIQESLLLNFRDLNFLYRWPLTLFFSGTWYWCFKGTGSPTLGVNELLCKV